MANNYVSVSLVDNNIDLIKQASKEQLEMAFEEIGLYAEAYAALKCPVDTGNLRASITHSSEPTKAIIGTNVEYAPYVELGTSKMKARPYLKPAIEQHLDLYKKILESYLRNA